MKILKLKNRLETFVDDSDFENLSKLEWKSVKINKNNTYVYTGSSYSKNFRFLHNFLLGCLGVDHIDGNGLNNQRSNLRKANQSQNGANRRLSCNNTSGYNGVYLHKPSKKWLARIMVEGKRIHLGYFSGLNEAALSYNIAATEHFGEFAKLNDIKICS